MTLGEVIARILNFAGDDYENAMQMASRIYEIRVEGADVCIEFVDANTPNVRL